MFAFIRSVSWQREALIFACAIITFAFTGPFGTYDDLTFLSRLLYWSVAILGSGVFFWTIMYQTIYRPWLGRFPKLFRLVVGAAIAAIPASVVIYILQINLRHIPVPVERLPWLWFVVLFVGIGIGVIYFISPFGRFLQPEHNDPNLPVGSPGGLDEMQPVNDINHRPVFFERLSDDLGLELVSLSMNDHYIEVVTIQGKAMLHMKFSDAMMELAEYPGAQIHRSHWVARRAVGQIEKQGRSIAMGMKDGRNLPISGTYKSAAMKLIES